MKRRVFLKSTLASGALATLIGSGLLIPRKVLASAWPKAAFDTTDEIEALKELFGSADTIDSDKILLKAPLQAENGAVVPIKITTSIDSVESIAVFVSKNPAPYSTSLKVANSNAGGMFSARIKMGQTSPVTCYVKAKGKIYKASQVIKVTVGGCGG